jgi:hypothetical protein
MKNLGCADFAAHINSKFIATVEEADPELDTAGKQAELTLIKADEHKSDECDCFSLIFDGPQDPVLQQRIYPMKHEALGDLALFIVPVLKEGSSECQYQAVFNRLKKKEQA